MNLDDLFNIIVERQNSAIKNSYVVNLFQKGVKQIARKVGEESVEVILATMDGDRKQTVKEVADLWFHSLVLLASQNITPRDVYKELEQRHKINRPTQKGKDRDITTRLPRSRWSSRP